MSGWLERVGATYKLSRWELLTLIRNACGHPLARTDRELSTAPAADDIAAIAHYTRQPYETIAALTLAKRRPLWTSADMACVTANPHALHPSPYCRLCLARDIANNRPAHFRTDWLSAFAFRCPVHGIALDHGWYVGQKSGRSGHR